MIEKLSLKCHSSTLKVETHGHLRANFWPEWSDLSFAGEKIMVRNMKRVLRKHWWIVPAGALGLGAVSVGVATQLPKQYTSQTLVLLARPAVPEDYVKPAVREDLTRRLASMKGQILSRTRLEPVIEKLKLYPEDRAKLPMEALVERLGKAVVITPLEAMPGIQYANLPGLSVNVTFNNPKLAQQICTELTSVFTEQNARSLEQQASRTTLFLGQQLDEAKAKLDEQDAKLAQFKRQSIGMPEEKQRNLSLLGSLNSELDATTQALTRAREDKTLNETLLSQQEASWKASQTGQNPESLEDQLRARRKQLTILLSRYTAEHPDVVKLKTEIAELTKKIKEMPTAGNSPVKLRKQSEPTQIQQLRERIRQGEFNHAELEKRQSKIQEQIKVIQSHLAAGPMVELQLKELTRNYQSAQDFYNELLKKRENSAMATDLVHRQEGEQFRVLDPPSLPTSPSFPQMLNFAGGGLGGGTVLGLVILCLLMAMDKTLHTEREVEKHLKLPVLASIPMLEAARGSAGLFKPPVPARD
jgi:polysaccharide chain length determinant protein (PEP-CTERM system associated)